MDSLVERLLSRMFKREEINGRFRCPTYLFRWTLFQPKALRGFGIYLHKFVGDDWSLDLHDHPKRFISIGLKGSYVETTPVTQPYFTRHGERIGQFTHETTFRAPWLRTFPASHVHRISGPTIAAPCWTLVIVLTHVREWGFWHQSEEGMFHRWIPWRRYVGSEEADKMKAC